MKNENSVVHSKPSVTLSKKSDNDSPLKKLSSKLTYNNFVKQLTSNKNIFTSNKQEPSNTAQELFKNRTNSSSDIGNMENKRSIVNFNRELEDPDNQKVKNELEKMLVVLKEIKQIGENFEELEKNKLVDSQSLDVSKISESEMKFKYDYTSYLVGFKNIVDEYFRQQDEENSNNKNKAPKKRFSSELILTNLSNERKHDISSLENVYNLLGHEAYTKLIIIFEKYCFFGKSNINYNMEYSQFSNFMNENNLHDEVITKIQSEMMFNKIKSNPKSINFEEFINVLLEFSKLIFHWEKKPFNSFRFFINKSIQNIQCLQKSEEDKTFERWYFMFENESIYKEVKKHLPFLYKIYKNFKLKDLRYGECMDTSGFTNFAKEYTIIPNYLSTKETNYIINFVKYKKKSLIPNDFFDFCAFVEIITLVSIYSYEKTIKDRRGPKELIEISERIKVFIKYLRDVK